MKRVVLMLLSAATGFSAEVDLTGATHLGQSGVSVNAFVRTNGAPGRYWVVYGRSGEMNQRAAPRPLPPVLGAYLNETWDQDTAGWGGGLSGKDLVHVREAPDTAFVRYLGPTEVENRSFPGEPPGLDVNHIDGIGALHLCQYIYSSKLGASPLNPSRNSGLNLGGARPDLRDARVNLSLRGNGVVLEGAQLTFWAQSDHDPALQLTPGWVRANWAYTGAYATRAILDGQWNKISYVLENNTLRWTYGGNNGSQERAERYAYLNLDQTLGNLNANFFHLYIYVDGERPPKGTIDFDSLELKYRNHSLLYPAHGAKLVKSPEDGYGTPAYLVDGWRHGSNREWHSASAPSAPQAFVWSLPVPARLETLQIHQSERYPAREVATFVSSDGVHWRPLAQFDLPRGSAVSANHAHAVLDVSAENVTHFKLEILSGYEEGRWGLGEVELFGSEVPLASDPDGASLNVDLEMLSPGEEYSYQFVVETAQGEIRSPVGSWRVPQDDRPVLVSLWRQKDAGGSLLEIWARIAPRGHRTKARLEVLRDGQWLRASASHFVGNQVTERDVRFELIDLEADDSTVVRVVLEHDSATEALSAPQEIARAPKKNL